MNVNVKACRFDNVMIMCETLCGTSIKNVPAAVAE